MMLRHLRNDDTEVQYLFENLQETHQDGEAEVSQDYSSISTEEVEEVEVEQETEMEWIEKQLKKPLSPPSLSAKEETDFSMFLDMVGHEVDEQYQKNLQEKEAYFQETENFVNYFLRNPEKEKKKLFLTLPSLEDSREALRQEGLELFANSVIPTEQEPQVPKHKFYPGVKVKKIRSDGETTTQIYTVSEVKSGKIFLEGEKEEIERLVVLPENKPCFFGQATRFTDIVEKIFVPKAFTEDQLVKVENSELSFLARNQKKASRPNTQITEDDRNNRERNWKQKRKEEREKEDKHNIAGEFDIERADGSNSIAMAACKAEVYEGKRLFKSRKRDAERIIRMSTKPPNPTVVKVEFESLEEEEQEEQENLQGENKQPQEYNKDVFLSFQNAPEPELKSHIKFLSDVVLKPRTTIPVCSSDEWTTVKKKPVVKPVEKPEVKLCSRLCSSLKTNEKCRYGDKCFYAHCLEKLEKCRFGRNCKYVKVPHEEYGYCKKCHDGDTITSILKRT